MSGQVQIKDYNHLTSLDKYQKKLECQVKDWYMQEHFAIKTNYNETEALQAYLYTDLYSTSLKDCELYDFVDKSIRGALGDENIDIVDLKTMQVKYRDINNYYYSAANYEEVQF